MFARLFGWGEDREDLLEMWSVLARDAQAVRRLLVGQHMPVADRTLEDCVQELIQDDRKQCDQIHRLNQAVAEQNERHDADVAKIDAQGDEIRRLEDMADRFAKADVAKAEQIVRLHSELAEARRVVDQCEQDRNASAAERDQSSKSICGLCGKPIPGEKTAREEHRRRCTPYRQIPIESVQVKPAVSFGYLIQVEATRDLDFSTGPHNISPKLQLFFTLETAADLARQLVESLKEDLDRLSAIKDAASQPIE